MADCTKSVYLPSPGTRTVSLYSCLLKNFMQLEVGAGFSFSPQVILQVMRSLC